MDKFNKIYTRKHPNGMSYHVPFVISEEFRIESHGLNGGYFGDFINKLGVLEDLKLDIETMRKLAKVPPEKLQKFLESIK